MTEYRKAVPGDATILPGMRTMFADRSQRGDYRAILTGEIT